MWNMKCILHPTDYSDHSDAAFQLACTLARDCGSRIVVMHVAPLPPIGDAGFAAIPSAPDYSNEELEAQLKQIKAPDSSIRIEHRLERGEAAPKIVAVAQTIGADLIVVGTHGRTGLGRLLMGSVAEKVLRNAPCPVLSVKQPIPEAPANEAVTVFTLHDPIRAELIKAALKGEGISCSLAGTQKATAAGGSGKVILVQVSSVSAVQARELIDGLERKTSAKT